MKYAETIYITPSHFVTDGIRAMDVRTLCLAVLSVGDASGYEIKKQFESGPIGMFHAVSYGSIYPALTRLEDEGLIAGEAHEQEGRPDKKLYRLTGEGRRALGAALLAGPAEDRVRSDTAFMLFFAHLTPPEHIEKVVDDYIAWHHDRLARIENFDISRTDKSGAAFVHGLGLAIHRAKLAYLEENRDWLLDSLRQAPQRDAAGDD